jgi:hypothetical protein
VILACVGTCAPSTVASSQPNVSRRDTLWNVRAAAAYLDGREAWWLD